MKNNAKNNPPLDRKSRLPRVWSNQVLRQIAVLLSGEVINVSGWDDRDKEGGRYRDYFNASSYYISNHAGERGVDDARDTTDFNINLTQPLPSSLIKRFDVVFNHTTLEHIFEIETAFRNLCDLSRDIVIVIVPFAQSVHYTDSYGDYWRFTPMGLRRLFQKNGFEVVFESANRDKNAGIYIFFVGARNPGLWTSKMPEWTPIENLGDWIGANQVTLAIKVFNRVKNYLKVVEKTDRI